MCKSHKTRKRGKLQQARSAITAACASSLFSKSRVIRTKIKYEIKIKNNVQQKNWRTRAERLTPQAYWSVLYRWYLLVLNEALPTWSHIHAAHSNYPLGHPVDSHCSFRVKECGCLIQPRIWPLPFIVSKVKIRFCQGNIVLRRTQR